MRATASLAIEAIRHAATMGGDSLALTLTITPRTAFVGAADRMRGETIAKLSMSERMSESERDAAFIAFCDNINFFTSYINA